MSLLLNSEKGDDSPGDYGSAFAASGSPLIWPQWKILLPIPQKMYILPDSLATSSGLPPSTPRRRLLLQQQPMHGLFLLSGHVPPSFSYVGWPKLFWPIPHHQHLPPYPQETSCSSLVPSCPSFPIIPSPFCSSSTLHSPFSLLPIIPDHSAIPCTILLATTFQSCITAAISIPKSFKMSPQPLSCPRGDRN